MTYAIDKETFPRRLAKRYLVERAKNQLRSLLDEQISISESSSGLASEKKRKAYYNTLTSRKRRMNSEQFGITAEREAITFLKRISIDYSLPFQVSPVDLFDDIRNRIDFVVHVLDADRVNTAHNIGVQYTVSEKSAVRKRAYAAMSRVELQDRLDDVVVVVHPDTSIVERRARWFKHGRPVGGPIMYQPRHSVWRLFQDIMRDIFSAEEIQSMWKTIAMDFGSHR
ncbi:hypothetical protein A3B32_03240 [Candidatus Uhrbacteria bacterium RIFCSPLOWO2_01_FULL_53_9]|uniref:Uncharacterized protein n=3 Tax=Candidatus Uhriibacteriota TaxID=1752732 RepID=A0A1F7UYT1_9BACT|nr:MAG: hypothetical protein A3C17_03470 [Candidatus Uhrbacteria bacterium RIFCSPHIGHO2_02_FULL_53_13]OGL83419.1 MAG: hypothetical protein A3B32_03240 [Candidatus Uhrbacteria bacterium RIFCSPLOWO2_01_FULL_53_9]OGL90289.1 MAG: hypothetical protein A3I45_04585 [Candidatus Uhrbacteria bacterium RIFCSPLOWO2_02_FULL_53_10]